MAAVYWLSSLSRVPVPSFFLVHDFFSHALLYAGLSGLLCLALLNSGARKNFGFYALLIAIMYSFTDEGHQAFVPHRNPSASDLVADAVGAAFGVYVFYGLRRFIGQEPGKTLRSPE